MKIVKIILAAAVITTLGFFITKWLIVIDPPKVVTPPINQFTAKIQNDIDSLNQMPADAFCQNFYNNIQYLIADYSQKGFLGKSENDNEQWQGILSKNLYSAYAPKFVEQAMYVFNHPEWEYDDLKFIRKEVATLNNSTFLDSNGPVADSFNSIIKILARYDEVTGFIATCNGFSYSNYVLGSNFPDVSGKIQKSRAYLANHPENQYVTNCTRLKEGLQEIPKKLFAKHINYLKRKINNHGGRYTEFNSQADYSRTIYAPLKKQIDDLNKETYGLTESAFNIGYNSLNNLLSTYNRNATDYFVKIMEKNTEVKNFILSCNRVSPSNYGLNSSFPDVKDKIIRSRAYFANDFGNQYLEIVLNNNTEIKDDLKEVPKKLFDKHVVFLQKKIKEHGGRFTEYDNKSEYIRNIYNPLKNQIGGLNNDTYGLTRTSFNIEYNNLNKMLEKFNDEADVYYLNPKKWERQKRRGN